MCLQRRKAERLQQRGEGHDWAMIQETDTSMKMYDFDTNFRCTHLFKRRLFDVSKRIFVTNLFLLKNSNGWF